MTILRRVLISLFVVLALGVLGFYLVVKINGKKIFEQRLTQALQRNVQSSDVRFIFPLGLRVDDVNIDGLLQAKSMRTQLGLSALIGQELIISRLYLDEPTFYLQKTKESKLVFGEKPSETLATQKQKRPSIFGFFKPAKKSKDSEESGPSLVKKDDQFGVIIEYLDISNGSFEFMDHSKEEKLSVQLKEIDLKAHSLPYPLQSLNTKFNFTAQIVSEDIPFSGSTVEANGWINFIEKSMDGKFKIYDANDVVGLSTHLKSMNNELAVRGKVDIGRLEQFSNDSKTSDDESFENILMGALKTSGVEVKADFAFKTKLDNFEIGAIALSGKFIANQGGLKQNLKDIGKKFEKFGKQFTEKEQEAAEKKEEVAQ